MAKKTDRKYIPGTTKFGTFRYPKMNEPDTKGEYADNKYKTDFVMDDADTKAFKKELEAKAKELVPGMKNPHIPVATKDGVTFFRFKSQKKPLIVDSKNNKLPSSVWVRGGSAGRINYVLTNYEKGISLWLEAAQITELAEGSGEQRGFGEAEGYTAPEGADEENEAFSTEEDSSTSEETGDKFNL